MVLPPPPAAPTIQAPPPQAPGDFVSYPESQVYNTEFLVPDVSDVRIPQMLSLPPRFRLPFKAIYTIFYENDYKVARRQSVIERA